MLCEKHINIIEQERSMNMSSSPTHIVLRKSIVCQDWRIHIKPRDKNNGRKVLVNEMRPSKETQIHEPEWKPGPQEGQTPVLETGYGGVEVASFNQKAGQDRHKHLTSTEIYTVLEGKIKIRVNDEELLLDAGDEIIVLPGTVHEVLDSGTEFLVRLHAIDCHGDRDKYVSQGGAWCQALTVQAQKQAK